MREGIVGVAGRERTAGTDVFAEEIAGAGAAGLRVRGVEVESGTCTAAGAPCVVSVTATGGAGADCDGRFTLVETSATGVDVLTVADDG